MIQKKTSQSITIPLDYGKAMDKAKQLQTVIQLAFFFVGIALSLANMYLATRLDPVYEDITKLKATDVQTASRVDANKESIVRNTSVLEEHTKLLERIDERTKLIYDQLRKINN